jgi:hypothetical protein
MQGCSIPRISDSPARRKEGLDVAEELVSVFYRHGVMSGAWQRGYRRGWEPVAGAAGDQAGIVGAATSGDQHQDWQVKVREPARGRNAGDDDLHPAQALCRGPVFLEPLCEPLAVVH